MPFFKVFLLVWTALLFVEAFVGVFGIKLRSHERLLLQGQIAFRRPWAMRVAAGLFSVTVATWPLLIAGSASENHTLISAQTWALLTLSMVASFALSLVCVRASGPDDVVLMPDVRTFRRTTGWPIFPTVRSGTWDDIAGIYVWSNGGSGQIYIVNFLWGGQLGKTQIGHFGQLSRATQFADELSEKLGIKRIDPPP